MDPRLAPARNSCVQFGRPTHGSGTGDILPAWIMVSVAAGYFVFFTASSTEHLSGWLGDKFRKQYKAGMVMNFVIASALLVKEIRNEPFGLALIPLILLSPLPILRGVLVDVRMKCHRMRRSNHGMAQA
jgi:MFS family permease